MSLAPLLLAAPLPGQAADAPAAATPAATTAAPGATAPGALARWQSHELKFNYVGFTTRYTCDGIEGKVRQILLTFGARKDLKVQARGCDAFNRPSNFAWVTAEFSSLAPEANGTAADGVKAQWDKVQLAPNRPSYMGAGECELVQQMRELLQKGFALRDTDYRTSCMPHQVSIADYSVTTEVLKPASS